MTATSIITRLGLILQGSNANLAMLSKDEPQKSPGAGADPEESDDDNAESDDSDEGDEGSDDANEDESEGEKKPGKGEATDEEDADEDDANTEGDSSDEGEDESDSSDDGDPEGDDSGSEGDDSDDNGSGGEPSDEDSANDEANDADGKAEEGETAEGKSDNGTGAAAGAACPQKIQDAIDFAQTLIDALEAGAETGLVDNNSALGDALKAETKADLHENEQAWRPLNPELDSVATVRDAGQDVANALLFSVKREIAYLATKLRAKFLAARTPNTVHGVRKGRDLSERRLVESVVEIRAGRRPTRPDWDRHNRDDCSLATALVLDESGSMSHLRTIVARAALAIASPMDTLGAPCLVVGPRGGDSFYTNSAEIMEGDRKVFHRVSGITIDVFKDWGESLRVCLRRFPNVQASGGTPLEDGIQYAMQEMAKRTERHRVILVLTDGVPANPAVCKRQIRQAAEAGIHIIGVALDNSCAHSVKLLFPEHILISKVEELPNTLLGVLDTIVFPKVGRNIKFDVTLNAKKDKK